MIAAETGLCTSFAFTLPKGYVDAEQRVHREGIMRLATARDEIMPLRDPRVRDHEAYLSVLLLSRVVESLGDLESITPAVVEGLFAADMAHLQELYRQLNQEGTALVTACCPHCEHVFSVDMTADASGES